MDIDRNISYSELIDNAKAIKSHYIGLLSSFSIYEIRKKTKAIYDTKKEIYGLNLKCYQADKIWEYLNGDMTYIELQMLRNLK